MRAELRADRSEVLLTNALRRGGRLRTSHSTVTRSGDEVELSEAIESEDSPRPLLDSLVDAWETWPPQLRAPA